MWSSARVPHPTRTQSQGMKRRKTTVVEFDRIGLSEEALGDEGGYV